MDENEELKETLKEIQNKEKEEQEKITKEKQETEKKKSNKNLGLAIGLVILIVLIAIGCVEILSNLKNANTITKHELLEQEKNNSQINNVQNVQSNKKNNSIQNEEETEDNCQNGTNTHISIQDTLTQAVKPVIYIYPTETTQVNVSLSNPQKLTCTYPTYNQETGWNVIAEPDGKLTDTKTNRELYCLYWEGKDAKTYLNYEDGFVVKGSELTTFFEEKLEILGLNEKEAEEFIIYWLPIMQNNEYNYIRFQTAEEINENMELEITPEPETLIRIMMDWEPLDKYIEIKEQQLEQRQRIGYTVVEWGGTRK